MFKGSSPFSDWHHFHHSPHYHWDSILICQYIYIALGSMLWSQFSAIFDNFRRKNWRFLKNQCYDQNFAKFSFILSQKRQFFRWIFWRKYFKNHNIGPWFVSPEVCIYLCLHFIVCVCVGGELHTIHSAKLYIKTYNTALQYQNLKPCKLSWIRTRDDLTRWPRCHAGQGNDFNSFFSSLNLLWLQKVGKLFSFGRNRSFHGDITGFTCFQQMDIDQSCGNN
jgi:hypothetical protein